MIKDEYKPFQGSDWCMPDSTLMKELAKARERVRALEDEQNKRNARPHEIALAIRLHTQLCNHRECDFGYQNWNEPVMSNLAEPGQYLEMAKLLMCHFEPQIIEKLLQIVNLRK